MFQIVQFQKILEGQCLNKNRLTSPLYILFGRCTSVMRSQDKGLPKRNSAFSRTPVTSPILDVFLIVIKWF